MQLDQNSFYRNKITPWYDSNSVCWIFIVLSAVVFFFGLTGIMVAATNPHYKAYLWLPYLLSGLSLIIIIKIIFRLIKRNKTV